VHTYKSTEALLFHFLRGRVSDSVESGRPLDMHITAASHLDHALTLDHVRWLLDRFRDREAFFIETVELPPTLPELPCALRGPAAGTAPVPDDEVILQARNGRAWPSRLMRMGFELMRKPGHVPWAPLYTRTVTVIGGPAGTSPCVLYTAYGGPCAPREPGDPSLTGEALEQAQAFWREHALVP